MNTSSMQVVLNRNFYGETKELQTISSSEQMRYVMERKLIRATYLAYFQAV